MVDVVLYILIRNLIGLIILIFIMSKSKILGECINADFLSPVWIYKNYKLNWFGTIIVCLCLNILCPILSIGVWFCKLCTVGRK